MSKLNYHHFYYFWQVMKIGNLTRAAKQLHVSQSALSTQIKQLEHSLGVSLFQRAGRKLLPTETGQRAFAYAEEIFTRGEELQALISQGEIGRRTLQIGVLATMSRNFVDQFIQPLIDDAETRFVLETRGQTNLLNGLANHEFDLVLTNIEVQASRDVLWQCRLLYRQSVAAVGRPGLSLATRFDASYLQLPWVLPIANTPIRSAFDGLCASLQQQPDVIAEANDMAMLRLLARDTGALTAIPDLVVRDELENGTLKHYCDLPNLFENFYAVTLQRRYYHPQIANLLQRW